MGDRGAVESTRALGAPTVRVLVAAALLAEHADLDVLARVSQVNQEAAAAALGELAAHGVLRAGLPVTFVDETDRAAYAQLLPEPERALLHARCAAELLRRGASDAAISAHLLNAPGASDQSSTAVLRRHARDLLSRGSASEAATSLERALREPPPADEVAAILVELADCRLQAGERELALDAALRGRSRAGGTAIRAGASVAIARAQVRLGRSGEAVRTLTEEIAAVEAVDANLAVELELELVRLAPSRLQIFEAVQQRYAARVIDDSLPAAARYVLAMNEVQAMGGAIDAAEAAAVVQRRLAGNLGAEPGDAEEVARSIWLFYRADRVDLAIDLHDRAIALAPELERSGLLAALRGLLMSRSGPLADAVAQLRAAAVHASTNNDDFGGLAAAAFLVHALHDAGDPEAVAALLSGFALTEDGKDDSVWTAFLRVGQGRHDLEAGRVDDALRSLLLVEEQKQRLGLANPAGFHQAVWATEGLVALGRLGEARRLARRNAERARRWGSPVTVSLAERAIALTEPPSKRAATLASAFERLDGTPFALERGQLALDLGEALRSARRLPDAERSLRIALDLGTRVGAFRIARRAEAALRALGRRPRRPHAFGVEALTDGELRVARLAAAGYTNMAIADALHLSVRTIENHLSRAYRKLETRRPGLAQHFDARADPEKPEPE